MHRFLLPPAEKLSILNLLDKVDYVLFQLSPRNPDYINPAYRQMLCDEARDYLLHVKERGFQTSLFD